MALRPIRTSGSSSTITILTGHTFSRSEAHRDAGSGASAAERRVERQQRTHGEPARLRTRVERPPSSVALSLMPLRPRLVPVALARRWGRRRRVVDDLERRARPRLADPHAHGAPGACRAALVSASRTITNAARPTAAGTGGASM